MPSIRRFKAIFSLPTPFLNFIGDFFKSNIDGARTIWQHWIKTPLSDLGTGLSVFGAILSGLMLYRAKNRNLGKTFDFLYATLQVGLALLVFVASLATGVTLAAIAVNMVYSLGGLAYSVYKYRKYSKMPEYFAVQQSYKKAAVGYSIGVVMSVVSLTTFLLLSLFFPVVPAAVSLGVGLSIAAMFLCFGGYKAYKFFWPTQSQKNIKNTEAEIYDKQQMVEQQNLVPQVVMRKSTVLAEPRDFEYYYKKNFSGVDELIIGVYKKILCLEKQIREVKGGVEATFCSQESKRQAKLDVLNESLSFLLSTLPSRTISYIDKLNDLDAASILRLIERHDAVFAEKEHLNGEFDKYSPLQFQAFINSCKQKVYQSFFRAKGEVEVLVQAIEGFCEELIQKQSSQKQPLGETPDIPASYRMRG